MFGSIAARARRRSPGSMPDLVRWGAVPVFVGAAYLLRIGLDGTVLSATPLLLFMLAVLASALTGGAGPGLLATAASLVVASVAFGDDAARGFTTAQSAFRGALFAVIGAVLSIAVGRLHRQRRRLRAALDGMRLVADNAPVMFAHCDRDLRLLFVSREYCAQLGVDPGRVIGRRVGEIVPPAVYAEVEPHLRRALAGERVEFETELRYDRPGPRYVRCVYVPDRDAGGTVRGLFVANTDLTEHRRLEERLRESDRRKDEYLAVLSHELRNPLAPIRTAVALMHRVDVATIAAPGDRVVAEAVPMIERQVAQLTRLVDDLLDATRMSLGRIALERAPCSLAAAVRVALDAVRELVAARGHRLSVDLPDPDVVLLADAARLAQVVANLLNNAAKFTPEGGRIGLIARVEPDGATLRLAVSDDGIGLAPGRSARIFGMFEQGERPADLADGGLGIGLALVHELVRLHGGTITATSDGAGRGSTFTVRLPLGPPGAVPGADAGAGTTPRTGARPFDGVAA